ncbi:protease modulator HflC [Candidatus Poribacteria bacterium]
MTTKTLTLIIIIVVLIIIAIPLASSIFYVVREGEQVVITQFGKPVGAPIKDAGLNIKTPFIQDVHRFDKRILEWDGSPNQIPTKDKKYIWLDTTARWRIKEALTFYQALGTERSAQSRLDDIIDSAARDVITSQVLIEAVRNSNRPFVLDPDQLREEEAQSSDESPEEIKIGREDITGKILEKAQESVDQYGIELIGVRIKRINYVDEVRAKVFDRMISERQRIAELYRSEGEGEAADIKGQKQKELDRIESEAYERAEQLKGAADAKAIRIYAEAYEKDPEFYAFTQTLETYRKIGNENTRLILTTDSDLYKYLKSSGVVK